MTTFARSTKVTINTVPLTTPLWRYQDLAKLLWTLENKSLWFARADTLDDPFEGSITKYFRDAIRTLMHGTSNEEAMLDQFAKANRAVARNAVVNCWHANEHESAAMWRLYVGAGQGIAIRSTVQRFVDSFPHGYVSGAGRNESGEANMLEVEFGPVSYIDYFNEESPLGPLGPWLPVQQMFWKRKSFEHEREFRAVIFDMPIRNNAVDLSGCVFPDGGVAVPINLEVLVESIHVAPSAPNWFSDVVTAMVHRIGWNFPVRQSTLDADPLF